MKEIIGVKRSSYASALMFVFLFGSLMALLYIEEIEMLLAKTGFSPGTAIAVFFILGALMNSSLNGIVFLPIITVLIGIATTLHMQGLFEATKMTEIAWNEQIYLFAILPLHFVISNFGIEQSCFIRKQISRDDLIHRRSEVISYIIMFAVFAAIIMLAWHIVII